MLNQAINPTTLKYWPKGVLTWGTGAICGQVLSKHSVQYCLKGALMPTLIQISFHSELTELQVSLNEEAIEGVKCKLF